TANNAVNLNIASEGDLTVGTVDVNNGVLDLQFDSDNDDAGTAATSARTLTATALSAGTVLLAGGTDGNEQFAIGQINAGSGGLAVASNMILLTDLDITSLGGAVFSGSVNGNQALTIDAVNDVVFANAVGTEQTLASLTVDAASISLPTVITSGAQTYTGSVAVNGDLQGGSLIFNGTVNVLADLRMVSDTIDFNGGANSVTGSSRFTLLPATQGADISIGGSDSVLNLNADALSGYAGDMIIGGIVNGFDLTQVAGDITVNDTLSLAGNATLILFGDSIILASGTLAAQTLILLAADQQGVIANTGGDDTLLSGELIVLVAGGSVGATGDINAQAPSGSGILELASGSPVAAIINIGNSLAQRTSPNTVLADAYAEALGLDPQSSTVTNTALTSAGREQTGELEDEDYIDPSLFENISLFEVFGTGILLPADQREEEEEDEDEAKTEKLNVTGLAETQNATKSL
ncbi:MAG TPA: hypothetical protein VFP95_03915, partial [Gammaproteobacteria bacterium]|nr:hypothetical protein [Gammaproteobacteria bacterium]